MNSNSEVNYLRCDLKTKNQKLNHIAATLGELTQQKRESAKHMVFIKDQSKQQNEKDSVISKLK